MQQAEESKPASNIDFKSYKIGPFCTHRSDKGTASYVDVICNQRANIYHRVSQIGKICNKCASVISKTPAISNECLYCLDKI